MCSRRKVLGGMAAATAMSALWSKSGMVRASKDKTVDLGFVDYTARDYELTDYQFYGLEGVPGLKFRGPKPDLTAGDYFSCVGASQTLGVFIDKPYPVLLQEELGMQALNLGLGAVSPGFLLDHDALIEYVNRGKFVILQVMAARASENSRLKPSHRMGELYDTRHNEFISEPAAWVRIMNEEPEKFPFYVAQSQNSWVGDNLRLLEKITVPVILFWQSIREIVEDPTDLQAKNGWFALGEFPHAVDGKSLEVIRRFCDGFAHCTSKRNFNFPLISRFTGKNIEIDYSKGLERGSAGFDWKETRNHYYHSNEMNEDAVPELITAIRQLDKL